MAEPQLCDLALIETEIIESIKNSQKDSFKACFEIKHSYTSLTCRFYQTYEPYDMDKVRNFTKKTDQPLDSRNLEIEPIHVIA